LDSSTSVFFRGLVGEMNELTLYLSRFYRVTEERQKEMHSAISEAVGDMPIVVLVRLVAHQVRLSHDYYTPDLEIC